MRHDQEKITPNAPRMSGVILPVALTLAVQAVVSMGAVAVFFSTMQLCLTSFMVTYLIEDVGMTLVQAGILLSTAQASGIVGRILWGGLADRCVKPRLMLGILGMAMTAGALSAGAFSPQWPFPAIMLACGLFGAAAIGWNGVYLAEVARVATPEHAGMATGGSLFFTFCGVLIGLPAFSLIVDQSGSYPLAFGITAMATLACGAVLLFTRPAH